MFSKGLFPGASKGVVVWELVKLSILPDFEEKSYFHLLIMYIYMVDNLLEDCFEDDEAHEITILRLF